MAAAAAAEGDGGFRKIMLRCSDGEEFEVEESIAMRFQPIRHIIEDGCADETIPLTHVTGKILCKVIEYSQKHEQVEASHIAFLQSFMDGMGREDQVFIDEELKAWDTEFIKVDQNTLFDLMLAANYLNVKGLLDLTCQAVANMIKGKSIEEIRATFHIKNDYTPEEEEKVRRENQWAFE